MTRFFWSAYAAFCLWRIGRCVDQGHYWRDEFIKARERSEKERD